jgi:hypothetical protein
MTTHTIAKTNVKIHNFTPTAVKSIDGVMYVDGLIAEAHHNNTLYINAAAYLTEGGRIYCRTTGDYICSTKVTPRQWAKLIVSAGIQA